MSALTINPALASPMNLLNSSAVKPKASAATASTTSSDSGLTGSTAGTTFLNLLVKELQNQDPTAPMDSTAMVGQMISLNQLDQLISINQVLSTATGATAAAKSAQTVAAAAAATPAMSSADEIAQRASLMTGSPNANAIQAATQAASDPTKTLDLSTLNIPNGGK